MTLRFYLLSIITYAFVSIQCGADEVERLKRKIALLEQQNLSLNSAIADSRKVNNELELKVEELSSQVSALGLYSGSKDERLLQAVADGRILHKQISSLRLVAISALEEMREFVSVASVEDAEKRTAIEVTLRKLDIELTGLSQRKGKVDVHGSLQEAKVVSIDSASGMLVANIGSKQKAKVGSSFKIFRGERELGRGTIVEVRGNVSGVLAVSKVHQDVVFKIGDRLQINLQSGR